MECRMSIVQLFLEKDKRKEIMLCFLATFTEKRNNKWIYTKVLSYVKLNSQNKNKICNKLS